MPESEITVPLLDLKAQYATLRDEIEPVIRKVVEDQWFIMGPEVSEFESECAAYMGVKHAIGCASGSDAILLACMALDIGCGGGTNNSVVCPAYTFFSTGGSVWRLGAVPVFADIEPTTYNMDLRHARELCEREHAKGRLGGIMPVHLFGRSANMDGYLELAEEFGVPLIEDAAQAIGTKDHTGAMVGTRGRVGCFSFFPSKNLGGFGDAGLVTTNDDEIADRVRKLRVHGMEPKYYHSMVGLNSRLDALQAAVLRIKLRHLESWHEGRRENAAAYDAMFAEAGARQSGIRFEAGEPVPLRTPSPGECGAERHIYNQYVVRVPASIREPLRAHLRDKNVGHDVYYPVPLHEQECFRDLPHRGGTKPGELPESEAAAKETVAIPVYPELTTEQRRYVVDTIVAFVKEHAASAEAISFGEPAGVGA